MLYKGLALMVLATLCSPASWAGDPWKDKPQTDWTMADTTKILTNSPWVKDARVNAAWIKGQPKSLFPMLGGCGGRLDPDEIPSAPDLGPSFQSVVVYRVSWVSSRTYVQAKIRRQMLCGDRSQEEVEDALEQGGPEDYVLHLESPDMTPFDGRDENAIQQNTLLIGKKSGLRLPPAGVQLLAAGGGRIFGVVFHFPKTTPDGKPVLAPDESELALSYKFGKIEIKVRFQPERMMRSGAADL